MITTRDLHGVVMDPEHVGWSDHFLYREKRKWVHCIPTCISALVSRWIIFLRHQHVQKCEFHARAEQCSQVSLLLRGYSEDKRGPCTRMTRTIREMWSLVRRIFFAWPLRKDDTHNSRNVVTDLKYFLHAPCARMTRIIRFFFLRRRLAWSPVQG